MQPSSLPLTLGLMLYSAVWLITLGFAEKFRLLSTNRRAAIALAYFLWVVIGSIYSQYPDEALTDIVLKVPFAAWAILLGTSTLLTFSNRDFLIKAFTVSAAIAVIISFIIAFYKFISTGDHTNLYFHKLINYDIVPPHYFGMYINFSYGIVLYYFIQGKHMFSKKWVSLLMLLLFFMMLVFISVRMQLIVFILVNGLVLGYYYKGMARVKKILIATGVVGLMFMLVMIIPGPRSRLMDTVNEIISYNGMVNDKQTNPRKFIWKEGYKVCKENFWLGTGTAGANQELNFKLKKLGVKFWNGATHYDISERNYNYHNSYLQHWATHGIIGLILLLLMLFGPFYMKITGPESTLFILVCSVSFITESMLERQAGVLFFSFFYSVFFILKPSKEELKKPAGQN